MTLRIKNMVCDRCLRTGDECVIRRTVLRAGRPSRMEKALYEKLGTPYTKPKEHIELLQKRGTGKRRRSASFVNAPSFAEIHSIGSLRLLYEPLQDSRCEMNNTSTHATAFMAS